MFKISIYGRLDSITNIKHKHTIFFPRKNRFTLSKYLDKFDFWNEYV